MFHCNLSTVFDESKPFYMICKDVYQNKYWEATTWYKFVDSRILTPEELKKIKRKKSNHTKYDNWGFDPKTWLHRNGWRYNSEWYDIEGYDENWLDRDGFNRRWFNPKTRLHRNGTYYDDKWYDIDGYNEYWYDECWHPRGRDPLKEEEEKKAREKEIKEMLG